MHYEFWWDYEEGGNVGHIADNDLTPADVQNAFQDLVRKTRSRSSNAPALYGHALDERLIFVVYEEIDDGLIQVITAYEVGDPR